MTNYKVGKEYLAIKHGFNAELRSLMKWQLPSCNTDSQIHSASECIISKKHLYGIYLSLFIRSHRIKSVPTLQVLCS